MFLKVLLVQFENFLPIVVSLDAIKDFIVQLLSHVTGISQGELSKTPPGK